MKKIRTAACLAATVITAMAGAGCQGSNGNTPAQARFSSAMANPAASADAASLEGKLLAAYQAEINAHPAHPVTDIRTAVRDVFPGGNSAEIEQYAASHFTPAVVKPGTARQQYLQGIVAYALSLGTVPASPGPQGSGS
jgi:hypothetical protein